MLVVARRPEGTDPVGIETRTVRDAEAVLRAVTGLAEYMVFGAEEHDGSSVIDLERTRREAPSPAPTTPFARL